MIKVTTTGNEKEDLRRVVHAMNFSEAILPFPAVGSPEVIAAGALTAFGGVAVDRSVFRQRLPDDRWIVYAAGIVETSDANTVTIDLRYELDSGATVTLGTITYTGAMAKRTLGPFDVFGTGGVPKTETVPVVRLFANKNVAGTAALECWVIWLRLLAPRQS